MNRKTARKSSYWQSPSNLSSSSVAMSSMIGSHSKNSHQNPKTYDQNESEQIGLVEAPLDQAMKCLSYFQEGHKVAFACYDEDSNDIIIEETCSHDMKDTEVTIESFLAASSPNLILVSGKVASNPSLLKMLTATPIPDSTPENENNTTLSAKNYLPGGNQPETSNDSQAEFQRPIPGQRIQKTIPYRLLKSGAYDLRNCRSIILNKLRVLTLLKHRNGSNQTHGTRGMNHNSWNLRQDSIRSFHNTSHGYNHYEASSYNSVASVVNFDSPSLLRALGSLLSFLQSTIFRLEEGSTITINTIKYAHSDSFMKIDSSTLRSLHIFNTEYHPLRSLHASNEKAKEGFSLFTFLDKTNSKMGRSCLRKWMMKPLLSIRKINERMDGVELMLHPDCAQSVGKLVYSLKKLGAVDKILTKLKKCHSSPLDFLVLIKTLSGAMDICSLLAGDLWQIASSLYPKDDFDDDMEMGSESNESDSLSNRAQHYLKKVLEHCHIPVLRSMHDHIVSIVDEEITADTKDAVCIQYGFNEELDNAKEAFERLDETLSTVGAQVLNKYPQLRQLKVIYLPQVGFLTSLDKRHHSHDISTNEFQDLPPTFSFVFIQDNDAFFKNSEMRQLDEEIGDLDAFIKDTEAMIVSELEESILDCESELRETFESLAELDCILSLATCAAESNFVRPMIIEHDIFIHIENGRHPLQELVLEDEFIPNNIDIDKNNRINIVTGPNFSGKSCYIRQVGLLVYMAQIGSFLPCEKAKLSVVKQIMARISSAETCSIPQSTFQIDLTEMATILRKSSPSSLVLIDEFGKGTAPASGIAVLTSALKHLNKINCKVVCTTHFLEIFSLGLFKDDMDGIKVLRMAVHIPSSVDDDGDPIPLFKLEDGVAESSAGLACAKMAGVNRNVVERAQEILTALKTGHPVEPISSKINLNSISQSNVQRALSFFLSVDSWNKISEDEIARFKENIFNM